MSTVTTSGNGTPANVVINIGGNNTNDGLTEGVFPSRPPPAIPTKPPSSEQVLSQPVQPIQAQPRSILRNAPATGNRNAPVITRAGPALPATDYGPAKISTSPLVTSTPLTTVEGAPLFKSLRAQQHEPEVALAPLAPYAPTVHYGPTGTTVTSMPSIAQPVPVTYCAVPAQVPRPTAVTTKTSTSVHQVPPRIIAATQTTPKTPAVNGSAAIWWVVAAVMGLVAIGAAGWLIWAHVLNNKSPTSSNGGQPPPTPPPQQIVSVVQVPAPPVSLPEQIQQTRNGLVSMQQRLQQQQEDIAYQLRASGCNGAQNLAASYAPPTQQLGQHRQQQQPFLLQGHQQSMISTVLQPLPPPVQQMYFPQVAPPQFLSYNQPQQLQRSQPLQQQLQQAQSWELTQQHLATVRPTLLPQVPQRPVLMQHTAPHAARIVGATANPGCLPCMAAAR